LFATTYVEKKIFSVLFPQQMDQWVWQRLGIINACLMVSTVVFKAQKALTAIVLWELFYRLAYDKFSGLCIFRARALLNGWGFTNFMAYQVICAIP